MARKCFSYREPVRVEQPSTATADRDVFGHIDETATANWSTYAARIHSRVKYSSGTETNADERQDGSIGGTCWVRYSATTKAIDRTMRLIPLWDTSRAWNIVAVVPDPVKKVVRIDWREDA